VKDSGEVLSFIESGWAGIGEVYDIPHVNRPDIPCFAAFRATARSLLREP